MSVQGVSTRTGKAVTEELCGHTFSASTVSRIKKSLDGLLRRVAQRRLEEASPDVILDARDEKVRRDGVIQSPAVFMALGINEEGRRQVLGVELSTRESRSSWTTFVTGLQTRGLPGGACIVSDDHAGIKRAVRELLPEAGWPRGYVPCLRKALDYLPRKADDDGRQELRWLSDRRHLKEAQQDLHAGGQDLSQRRALPPVGPSPLCRNPRGLARGSSLLEHGVPERTEERTADRRLTDHSLSHESAIAQLDVHNRVNRMTLRIQSNQPSPRGDG